MRYLARLPLIFALVIALIPVSADRAAAGSGSCASNPYNYFSSACYYKDTQYSGAYVARSSVALNITQTAASSGEYISEHLILRDRQSAPAGTTSFLEVGDTAGGGQVIGHVHEWARMWYWAGDANPSRTYTENFIQYAPNDSVLRGWGMQWETSSPCATNAWVIYIAGSCKAVISSWNQPTNTADMKMFTGLEVGKGGAPLDASENSGLFDNQQQQWRDLTNTWHTWDLLWTQVDSPCGTAPTCLQGWWTGIWNNAKPAQ